MKIRKQLAASLAAFIFLAGTLAIPLRAQQGGSRAAGRFNASYYNYGSGRIPGAYIAVGNTATGSQTISVCLSSTGGTVGLALPDGRTIIPFSVTAPITVDRQSGTLSETVTPTAVSTFTGLPCNGNALGAQITASFSNAHGASLNTTQVASGTFGLQEAINDAFAAGGGLVSVDRSWGGGSQPIDTLTSPAVSTTPQPNVSVEDTRFGAPSNWNPTPTGLALAAPTLPAINIAGQLACDATHQMCSDASVAGSASWGSTVYACWTYVDIFGNEGPCSATTSWTSAASKAIDLGIPAASPGAVGAVPYLSLSGGTYALAYQIPVTATVCTMTKLETITPACAVANPTYGQSASTFGAGGLFTTGGAQITGYPVNTSMTAPVLATTANTLTAQHPMTNSSVSYAYAPGSRVGSCGITPANMVQISAAGGINGSSATTVPNPLVSWTVPAGCFNHIGAEFRVTGKFTYTDGGDTSTRMIVAWDSNVTDTASVPTPLCNVLDTATGTGAAYNGTWSCTVRILTTAVAAGTGGTAMVNGYSTQNLAAGATTLVRNGADVAVAVSGAINTYSNGRIVVWFEGVGATNNPGAQALEATLEVLN